MSCGAIDDCLRRLGYDGIARRKPVGSLVRADLAARDDLYIVPHLVEVEVLGALRGMVAGGQIESHRMGQILTDLSAFPAERRSHTELLHRVWELRHNFTPYDAVYIALAEETGAVLYTTDQRLTKGHRAKVRCLGRSMIQ